MIDVPDVSEIAQAIVDLLKRDTRLTAASISRDEERNATPGQCPWIGVYRVGARLPVRTLTSLAGWRDHKATFLILVQAANPRSGAECAVALEALTGDVISALLSDTTLGGTVSGLDSESEFSVDYTRYSVDGGIWMQTAVIQFTTHGVTTGG